MSTTSRNTKTITFSLPPKMARAGAGRDEGRGRTMSELIREALRNYMEEREWLTDIRYERLKKREEEQNEATRRTDE